MASGQGHGSMSLSMKFIRLLIILFNLAFFVIGIILLAVGIYVIRDPKLQQLRPLLNSDITATYSEHLSNVQIFAIVLLIVGGILLFIGFLGCCGAFKGFRCLHLFYAIIIGMIILAEIALIILYIIYQNRFQNELVTKLQESIVKYYVGKPMDNSTNPISRAWDFAQFNLECCGALNKNDYLNATKWDRINPYQSNTTLTVPFSCCPFNSTKNWDVLPTNMTATNTCAITGINAYSQGCYNRLIDLLGRYRLYIIVVGIIIGIIEIFALLFAILLYCRKKDYQDV